MDGAGLDIPDLIGLTILEQMIKLTAICMKPLIFIEDFTEDLLNDRYLIPNCGFAAKLASNIGRRGEMVGMDVCVDDPLTAQVIAFDILNEFVS